VYSDLTYFVCANIKGGLYYFPQVNM